MKATILLLLLVTAAMAQEATPKRSCRYHLTILQASGAIIGKSGSGSSIRLDHVADLKRYIETIEPNCAIAVNALEDPKRETEFSHAWPELKAFCEARHIKLELMLP
jgi:hypothetical protein